jgi:hypothetical protein
MVILERGKNDGIVVYVPQETILKEMAAKIKLSQNFFSDLVREPCDSTTYMPNYISKPERILSSFPSQ